MHQTITPMPRSTAPGHHLFSVSGFASPGYCLCQLKKKKRCKKKKKRVEYLFMCTKNFSLESKLPEQSLNISQGSCRKLYFGSGCQTV